MAGAVARVAIFDEPPALRPDDARRTRSLHALLVRQPGFIAGYELREPHTGRLMSVTEWESEAALEAGERAVRSRPTGDQRGIRPSRIERWVVDAAFGSSASWARRSASSAAAASRAGSRSSWETTGVPAGGRRPST